MRRHRGLAVSRDPSRGESAILARMQPQRALALFLEDKAVLDDPALASGPGGGWLFIETRPHRLYDVHKSPSRGLVPYQDPPPFRIHTVRHNTKSLATLASG